MVLSGYTKHDRHIAGDTHIPSDMSMGIHKPQGHPYHCDSGDVLTACFRDIRSQRSIRMDFVIIMILFDVKDYRLLYGSISLSPHSEKIYT